MATRPNEARFSVGIDLGTTNSVLACAEIKTDDESRPIDVVPIPQLVAAGEAATLTLLPSFLYVVGDFDFPAGSLRLPWDSEDRPPRIVGELARTRGSENP